MSEPDVVGALDRWLWAHDYDGPIRHEVVQRARDVIVALEEMRQAHIRMLAANCDDARAEALEKAALECEARFCDGCAAGIRALKEKH